MPDKNLKTIMKFDTGADGFQAMIYVLAVTAAVVLGLGIYFLMTNFTSLRATKGSEAISKDKIASSLRSSQ